MQTERLSLPGVSRTEALYKQNTSRFRGVPSTGTLSEEVTTNTLRFPGVPHAGTLSEEVMTTVDHSCGFQTRRELP